LGGLVGGTRVPGRFLAGKTFEDDGHQPVHLIGLSDCLSALDLLFNYQSQLQAIFNLVYPLASTRKEFYTAASEQIGLPAPVFLGIKERKGKRIDGSQICQSVGFVYQGAEFGHSK